METSEILLKKALELKSQERFFLIEGLIKSLDEPDKVIDDMWIQEAAKRLQAHREGKTKGIPIEEIFKDEF